jgi:hypothetical protein
MKILYIEYNGGATDDMLISALAELHPNAEDFIDRLREFNLPGVRIWKKNVTKDGITGTHIGIEQFDADDEHRNIGVGEIEHILFQLHLDERVHNAVISVYSIIAQAEIAVHNCGISDIDFHDVGTMDRIINIVGVCGLIDELRVDKIVVSPINSGKSEASETDLVTAEILKSVPAASGAPCTPIGAALLKYFATEFSDMPTMSVEKVGYGFGADELEAADCVRAVIGEAENEIEKA